MGKKCICQICSCGKHRCPHMPSDQTRVINKTATEKCKVTEYAGSFKNASKVRGPFYRPKDLLHSEGDISFETVNKEDYVTHEIPEKTAREPDKYSPPTGKMDVDSEYQSHYLGEASPPAKIPAYIRNVTQKLPSGKIQNETTNKTDYKFHSAASRCQPVSRGDKYAPPKSPFNHTSVHRADFLRFNEPKRQTGRQPDKIDMKSLSMDFETSHKTDFKRYSIKRNEIVKRNDEYEYPSGPFTVESLMHTDFRKHENARKAQILKPMATVFKTDEKMERTTTNLEDFRTWPIIPTKAKAKEKFQQPAGEMYLKSTSSDYRFFGNAAKPAKSARPKTKLRTGRDGMFDGTSNYAADFKQWGSLPALPVKIKDELVSLSPRKTKFDANSEHRDSFKRFNTAPARIFKPMTTVFKTDQAMASKTVYMNEYDGKPPPPCLSDKVLKGEFSSIRFEEDIDTGHRYVIGAFLDNGSTNNNSNAHSNGNNDYTKLSSITEQKTETIDLGISHVNSQNTVIPVA